MSGLHVCVYVCVCACETHTRTQKVGYSKKPVVSVNACKQLGLSSNVKGLTSEDDTHPLNYDLTLHKSFVDYMNN